MRTPRFCQCGRLNHLWKTSWEVSLWPALTYANSGHLVAILCQQQSQSFQRGKPQQEKVEKQPTHGRRGEKTPIKKMWSRTRAKWILLWMSVWSQLQPCCLLLHSLDHHEHRSAIHGCVYAPVRAFTCVRAPHFTIYSHHPKSTIHNFSGLCQAG